MRIFFVMILVYNLFDLTTCFVLPCITILVRAQLSIDGEDDNLHAYMSRSFRLVLDKSGSRDLVGLSSLKSPSSTDRNIIEGTEFSLRMGNWNWLELLVQKFMDASLLYFGK